VEVLERELEPGGRMRSEARGDFVLDRGAQFVASGYRNLHALAGQLGLAGEIGPVACTRNAILRDGRLHAADYATPLDLLRSELLSGRARWRLGRLALELARRWRRLDPLHPERAARFDDLNLAAGLRRLVGEEAAEYLLIPALSATFDSDPEDLSLAFALLAARFVLGGFRLQAFRGGNGRFTRRLAQEVPVRTGCEVLSVETETGGARVRYRAAGRDSSVVADAVVVALPGCEVARVCPKLTPAERGFFEGVRYVRGIVAHLLFEEAPKTLGWYGISFPRPERFDLYGLAVDHHKPGAAPPGAGLLNAALGAAAAARLWEASDAAVADLVLENLAATPLGRLRPFDFAVHRWPAMLPQFGPRYLRRLEIFLGRLDRSPRLAFAGDYLVGPYTEAALSSGMRAATEIARLL
jgi:oxygen-dependent protoporphyrinogen oxidase